MRYERTSEIRTDRMDSDGIIHGTLATNGEASDGHILDISGMEVRDGAPLLFGHDDLSGNRNLGSWVNFRKGGAGHKGMKRLGDQALQGTATIERDGKGANADFRQDIAHMVAKGHIKSFSVRWDVHPEDAPVPRGRLDAEHPAFRDGDEWGHYFPRSVLLEGSLVTIGADPGATMRHALSREGLVRRAWLEVLGPEPVFDALLERIDGLELQIAEIEVASGEPMERGKSLGSVISDAMDMKTSDELSNSDIVSMMADAAGIEASTVNQIVNGSIQCPPVERLTAIAKVLGISVGKLISAAESDGCEYDERGHAATCGVKVLDAPDPEPEPAAVRTVPPAEIDVERLFGRFAEMIRTHEEKQDRAFEEMIRRAVGRV